MTEPELRELEQHLKHVSSAIHEASHTAAALGCDLTVRFVEVKTDMESSGRTDLTGFYENGKPATVGDLLFTTYAGIEADDFFNLNPGHNTDEGIVARLAALLPEAMAEKAKDYCYTDPTDQTIHCRAQGHCIQTRGSIDDSTTDGR